MKVVRHDRECPGGKRRFEDEHDAEKALGRARTRQFRRADAMGSRRGLRVESRYYYHPVCDGFHLTGESRRQHYSRFDMSAA